MEYMERSFSKGAPLRLICPSAPQTTEPCGFKSFNNSLFV